MIDNYLPTAENPLVTKANEKILIKQYKADFATKAELANYATTEALNAKADTASVTALETRIAAIETEVTGVAASLASIIGEKA